MADFPTAAQITQLASLLAPGFIIVAMRRKAITGALPSLKDELLLYGLASTAYLAAASPIFYIASGIMLPGWLWSVLLYAAWPVLFGTFLMFEYQKKWLSRLTAWTGLNLPHSLPAAWDFQFSELPQTAFVLVTLRDGKQVAGRWGAGSFASSDANERDLLISEVWKEGEEGQPWARLEPSRSILICGKDISSIEIF